MNKQSTTVERTFKGFSHHASEELIAFYRELPLIERLRWLEEHVEFMYKALTKEQWETLQKFRRGEL